MKFGDIEYFALLDFNDRLKYRMLDRLDLKYLDRLRNEIELKIMEVNQIEKDRRVKTNDLNIEQ